MLCTSPTCPWRNGQERIHHETCYDFFFYLIFLIIAYFLLTPALISFYEFAAIVKGNAEVGHSGVIMSANSYRLCMPMSNVNSQWAMLLVPENQTYLLFRKKKKDKNNNPTMSLVMMLPWGEWSGMDLRIFSNSIIPVYPRQRKRAMFLACPHPFLHASTINNRIEECEVKKRHPEI